MLIVATIGKSSNTPEKVKEILLAGADVLRYNFSHGSPEVMKKRVQVAKDLIRKLRLQGKVKIMADLPGAKIRLGRFPEKEFPVQKGQMISFQSGEKSSSADQFIPINHPHPASCLEQGQILRIGDGEVALKVQKIIDQNRFTCKALNQGVIRYLKGITLGKEIDQLDPITATTLEHIKSLDEVRPDWVAFSFVKNGAMLQRGKKLLQETYSNSVIPTIVSKIESEEALQNLEDIAQETDFFLVARGDLAIQAPYELLGLYQKKILQVAKQFSKKIIVSTQILESLTENYFPLRAEILDLTNIVLDGADGIMLCKETGLSQTPQHSIQVARNIIERVQEHISEFDFSFPESAVGEKE